MDQAVVSGGAFLMNILLARQLPTSEYGVFAILFGGMLTLQLFNATLLLHPLSVRLVTLQADRQQQLMRATLALSLVLSALLGTFLACAILALGRADLLLPALAAFFAWQMQEVVRRGLLTLFRHRDAVLGDAISYVGQAMVAGLLVYLGALTLPGALYGMAATSLIAAALQARQIGISLRGGVGLRRAAEDYWLIGGFWSLGNGLLSQLRVQILPWGLAAFMGPAAAAGFQAAVNVVNVANPIAISLGNIIPQTAAQAHSEGLPKAWKASKAYAWLAVPPILGYAVILVAAPDMVLSLLYGTNSDYATVGLAVRLLAVAAICGYATDVVIAFLHGIAAVPLAFRINLLGSLVTAMLALPAIQYWGLTGSCLIVIAANVVRLIAGHVVLTRLMAGPTQTTCLARNVT